MPRRISHWTSLPHGGHKMWNIMRKCYLLWESVICAEKMSGGGKIQTQTQGERQQQGAFWGKSVLSHGGKV